MTHRESLAQALDALIYHTEQTRPIERTNNAITAIREALAPPAIVPGDMVMVPTHLTVEQLESFVGHGLCCGTEPMPEAVIDAGHRWTRLLGKIAAAPAQPAGDVVVSKDEQGQIVAVTRQDSEGRILSVIAESAQPAVRDPLTDEQIAEIYIKWSESPGLSYADLIQMVEVHHGIHGSGK